MSAKVICPWCGSEMQLSRAEYYAGNDHAWFRCRGCGAKSPDTVVRGGKYDYMNGLWIEYPAEVEAAALNLQPCRPGPARETRIFTPGKMPCALGTRVYIVVISPGKRKTAVYVRRSCMTPMNAARICKDFGKTVFLTGEEAAAERDRIKAELEKGE